MGCKHSKENETELVAWVFCKNIKYSCNFFFFDPLHMFVWLNCMQNSLQCCTHFVYCFDCGCCLQVEVEWKDKSGCSHTQEFTVPVQQEEHVVSFAEQSHPCWLLKMHVPALIYPLPTLRSYIWPDSGVVASHRSGKVVLEQPGTNP